MITFARALGLALLVAWGAHVHVHSRVIEMFTGAYTSL